VASTAKQVHYVIRIADHDDVEVVVYKISAPSYIEAMLEVTRRFKSSFPGKDIDFLRVNAVPVPAA
jgi:hypothetical protein